MLFSSVSLIGDTAGFSNVWFVISKSIISGSVSISWNGFIIFSVLSFIGGSFLTDETSSFKVGSLNEVSSLDWGFSKASMSLGTYGLIMSLLVSFSLFISTYWWFSTSVTGAWCWSFEVFPSSLFISSSVCLTVNLSFIILFSILICKLLSWMLSKLLACLSDILLCRSASLTGIDKFSRRSLFAIVDWATPIRVANCSWVR